MKKILLLPLLFGVMLAHAQLQFGLKAGVNISNFTGGNFENVEKSSYTSFHAGGLVRIRFNHLVLQPEVLFSQQGAKLKDSLTESTYKVNYINIPIMLQWAFGGNFYIEAGPQAGFKVSEDVPNGNSEDFAKSTDWAAAFGLGFMKKDGGLGLGARYTVGISKVGNSNSVNVDNNFHNGVLQFSLMFIF